MTLILLIDIFDFVIAQSFIGCGLDIARCDSKTLTLLIVMFDLVIAQSLSRCDLDLVLITVTL